MLAVTTVAWSLTLTPPGPDISRCHSLVLDNTQTPGHKEAQGKLFIQVPEY